METKKVFYSSQISHCMASMHGFSRLCLPLLGTDEPYINEPSPNVQLLGKFLEYVDNLIVTAYKNLLFMTISEQHSSDNPD